MINTAPPASNSVYSREKLFWYDKINVSNHMCHRGAVVKELLKRADKPGSTPGNSVFCFFVPFCFFSCLVSFFQHYFSFWPVFLYSYCWPCWSCTRINIYFKLKSGVLFWKSNFKSSWSAYWPSLRPEKTTSCQLMSPLLSNSWIFFNVSWHHDKQHTVHHNTVHPPVIHWRNLNLPFVHRLNYQYYYPKISTGFASKK